MKLITSLLLVSVLSICKADNIIVEVFLDQTFQSEHCRSAEALPVWKIGNISLIHKSDIERYYGRVNRNPPDAPGEHWANLTLEHVNYTLNGSVLSCSTNLTLRYTLVVVNTTIQPLAPNDTFTPPVCKSSLVESRPPYWMIDGVILDDTTVNHRYGAEITRLSDDSKGRHQAKLTIHSVNPILIQNLSNISCAVGTELRMVYIILYNITGPGEEATPTPVTPGAESTEKVVAGTSEALVNDLSSRKSNNEGITIGEIAGVVIVILAAVAAIIILCVCVFRIRRKGWRNFFKTDKYERRRMDNRTRSDAEEDREEIDGVRHAPPHTSQEQKRERVVSDGPEEDGVHIVTADGPGIRRARAPRHTSEETKPLLRQRPTAK